MGLRQNQKQLHPKLFYDEKGSRMIDYSLYYFSHSPYCDFTLQIGGYSLVNKTRFAFDVSSMIEPIITSIESETDSRGDYYGHKL